ncbi:MAG: hypothetical protein JWN15_1506, partial [Firmicutes bacterium]|nr:hypothetical protein [Bacillota bacterium]
LLGPLLVAIYTYNYARWAGKQGLRRGAVGLYVLALAAVVVPGWLLFWPH